MSALRNLKRKRIRVFSIAMALAFALSPKNGRWLRCSYFAVGWAPPSPTRHTSSRRSVALQATATTTTRNELIFPSSDKPIRYVMAPMVAASDYPFRRLVMMQQHHGADLTYTQMLHARNLVEDKVFRQTHLDFPFRKETLTTSQLHCIEGMPQQQQQQQQQQHPEDGPLIVQLAGHDSDLMLRAFNVLMEEECEFAGIDVNLGCPQGIARKGNYGAFLHEESEDLVCDILTKLRQHVPSHLTVSAKIRLPRSLNKQDVKNRITRLTQTGINFLTVHGRTLEENKTKTGAVHVDMLKLAVETAGTVPVVVNGGIESHADVQTMLETTNAAAVMSSEALLETPNLFSIDSSLLSPQELFQQQVGMARDYIHLCAATPPLPGVLGQYGSFAIVKGHLFKILHRYLHKHTDLRDQLTKCTRLTHAVEVLEHLETRYPSEEACTSCPSSAVDASWYRRHWSANCRVHQRNRRQSKQEENVQSIDEKKEAIKLRIEKLRNERLVKKEMKEQEQEERLAV